MAVFDLFEIEHTVIDHGSGRATSIDIFDFAFRIGFLDGELQGRYDVDDWCSAIIRQQR